MRAAVKAGVTAQMLLEIYEAAWEVEHQERRQVVAEARHSASTRQRRKRQRDRERDMVDIMQEPNTEQDYADAALIAADEPVTPVTPVTVTDDKRNPHKENTSSLRSEVKKDGGGNARVSPMISISEEAFAIAEQLKPIARIDPDPEATPPGWCGAPMWAQGKLNAGIPGAVILAGSRAGMAHKRDGPPRSPRYFDEPIARLMAEATAPPQVSTGARRHGTHRAGGAGGLARLAAGLTSFG